jgi:hypothetical protein
VLFILHEIKGVRGIKMENKTATWYILLTALVGLMLLIGWGFVGPALGGTGAGGYEAPYNGGAPGKGDSPNPDPNPGPGPNPPPPPPPDSPGPDDPNPDDPAPPRPDEREDSDGDLIPDELEPSHNTDQFDWDSDNDHLSDGNEGSYTDPNIKDTDNDGI